MAKMTIMDLQRVVPRADFSGNALRISRMHLNEHSMRALNQFLSDNAESIRILDVSGAFNNSMVPLDTSWIAGANNLKTIHINSTKKIISDALVEQILKSDSIRMVKPGKVMEYHESYSSNDYLLLKKISTIMKVRNDECIELGAIDAKFGQLAFNGFTHTWLPYDAANKKWKLQEVTYNEYMQSFSVPGISLPAPAGVKISKIEMIKAEFMTKMSGMKHEMIYRQKDTIALTTDRAKLLETIENDADNGEALSEFARLSSVIGKHKEKIAKLTEAITLLGAEGTAKVVAQQALNNKWVNNYIIENFKAAEQALAEGGDIYVRNIHGDKELDIIKYSMNDTRKEFLTKAQAAQDARDEAAKVVADHAIPESEASASAGGAGVNLDSLSLDDVPAMGHGSAAADD